jgi:hypothetical protein
MNKSLLTLFALALMLGAKAQVVFNSGFQNWANTDPTDWTGSATNISLDSVSQVTSISAAQLQNSTTVHKRLASSAVSITNGQIFSVSYWARGNGSIRAGLFDGGTGVNAYQYSSYDVVSNTSAWTQYTHTLVADTTSANGQFLISVMGTSGSTHIQVDSFVVSIGSANVVSISQIQNTSASNGDSPLNNQTVSTGGIVTAKTSSAYWIQSGTGAWTGIYVFDNTNAAGLAIGDSVTMTALVTEYFNLTELKNVSNFVKVSSGNTVPVATVISTAAANTEDYEGVLVQVTSAQCTNASSGNGQWIVSNGTPVYVDDLMFAYTPVAGVYYAVTGPLYYSFSEWKIEPRMITDVTVATGIESATSNSAVNMFPNPSAGYVTLANAEVNDVVNVYDVSGKLVMSEKVRHNGNFNFNLNTNGVYFVQLINKSGTHTGKVVINN